MSQEAEAATQIIDKLQNENNVLTSSLSSYKILIITFALINIASLVSKSVMTTVDKNDGKDCPKVAGPAIACVFYGLSFLILTGMTIIEKRKNRLSNIKLGLFVLLIICNLSIFIAYIPFAVKSNKIDSNSKECLTTDNKKAIEIFEIIINGVLIVLAPIMIFM